jgi:3-phenylpropionate/trans-cinnamate dioxygenase ferredoxin reductase subunit
MRDMSERFNKGVLIIGAGQAAAQTAASLRQGGYGGAITIVGDEPVPPYQRPPLSKAFLEGKLTEEKLFVRPRSFYEKMEAELVLDARAVSLRATEHEVLLLDGRTFTFEHLVLATGGRPRRLTCPGAESPRLRYLRTIADVTRLTEQLRRGNKIVLIGGGYIGLEIAAVASSVGMTVTVIEAEQSLLARVASPAVAQFFADAHAASGVDIRCGVATTGIEDGPGGARVALSDGECVEADLVVAGIGLQPNVELAIAAGIECKKGIVVDDQCRTSAEVVYAAGDCTEYRSELYDRWIHLESVNNAIEQGKTVAAAIAQRPRSGGFVPWFWSDQYDIKLQTAGISSGFDEVVLRGDPRTRSFAAFYLRLGRLIAVDAINRPREFMASKGLIAEKALIAPALLADDSTPLPTRASAFAG